MTDINKALAFAKECLKWEHVHISVVNGRDFLENPNSEELIKVTCIDDIQAALETFLGNRFFIQINRGTSSLFKWSVIVGLQNRVEGPKGMFDHGHGEGDDMLDAIFDACVAAARLYPHSSPQS